MLLQTSRWQYHPPWQVTRPWLPRVFRGGDEWGNPSVVVVLPLAGMLVFFYGRRVDRSSWFLHGGSGDTLYYSSPDLQSELAVPAATLEGVPLVVTTAGGQAEWAEWMFDEFGAPPLLTDEQVAELGIATTPV